MCTCPHCGRSTKRYPTRGHFLDANPEQRETLRKIESGEEVTPEEVAKLFLRDKLPTDRDWIGLLGEIRRHARPPGSSVLKFAQMLVREYQHDINSLYYWISCYWEHHIPGTGHEL